MVKLNKIYTRTGDAGETGLVDGSRVSKADPRMAAIGDVDEANSAIGMAALKLADPARLDPLRRIQNDLFDLGADLATPGDDFEPTEMALRIVQPQIDRLEREIDALNDALEPLRSFILPGGTPKAAALHVARTICRRAERRVVHLGHDTEIPQLVVIYLNRLSDLLFTLARVANQRAGAGEVTW